MTKQDSSLRSEDVYRRLNSPEHEAYREVLLRVGDWKLLKRTYKGPSEQFDSMLSHDCEGGMYLRNGLGKQKCYACSSPIPDELWAMWHLHNGSL